MTKPKQKSGSLAEDVFHLAWSTAAMDGKRLPLLVREYQFHEDRRWRFDFAVFAKRDKCRKGWAIEIEGEGRHRSYMGFRRDCEKYNAAAAMGWTVLRVPASAVAHNPEGCVDEVWQLMCGSVPSQSVVVTR